MASSSETPEPLPKAIAEDLATEGAYHIDRGAREFETWSQRMIVILGERVRPYLQDAYRRAIELREREEDAQREAHLRLYAHFIGPVPKQLQRRFKRLTEEEKDRMCREVREYLDLNREAKRRWNEIKKFDETPPSDLPKQ